MNILKQLYTEVWTLEDWLYHADYSGCLTKTLVAEDDSESYKHLLKSVYVGVSGDMRQCSTGSLSQHSHLKEIILRVIERVLKKKGPGKNLLTFGFGLMSEDQNAQRCGTNIENKYPNSCVNRLFSKVWNTLLSRIGDEIMLYLLEYMSLFMEVVPTCFVQLTGTPLYNMWSYEAGSTLTCIETNTKHKADDKKKGTRKMFVTNKKKVKKNENKMKFVPKEETVSIQHYDFKQTLTDDAEKRHTTSIPIETKRGHRKRMYEQTDDVKYKHLREAAAVFTGKFVPEKDMKVGVTPELESNIMFDKVSKNRNIDTVLEKETINNLEADKLSSIVNFNKGNGGISETENTKSSGKDYGFLFSSPRKRKLPNLDGFLDEFLDSTHVKYSAPKRRKRTMDNSDMKVANILNKSSVVDMRSRPENVAKGSDEFKHDKKFEIRTERKYEKKNELNIATTLTKDESIVDTQSIVAEIEDILGENHMETADPDIEVGTQALFQEIENYATDLRAKVLDTEPGRQESTMKCEKTNPDNLFVETEIENVFEKLPTIIEMANNGGVKQSNPINNAVICKHADSVSNLKSYEIKSRISVGQMIIDYTKKTDCKVPAAMVVDGKPGNISPAAEHHVPDVTDILKADKKKVSDGCSTIIADKSMIPAAQKQRHRNRKRRMILHCDGIQHQQPFKPYEHSTYLPRNTTLFNRNVREKFPNSVALSKLAPTAPGVHDLYKVIFVDTIVIQSDYITVVSPDLQDIEVTLSIAKPDDEENVENSDEVKGHKRTIETYILDENIDTDNDKRTVPVKVVTAIVGIDTDNGNGPVPIPVGAAVAGVDTDNGNGPVPIPVGTAVVGVDTDNGNGPVPLPVGAAVVGVDKDNGNGPVPIQLGAADVGVDTDNGNGPVPIPVGAAVVGVDTDNGNGPVPIPVGAADVGIDTDNGNRPVPIPIGAADTDNGNGPVPIPVGAAVVDVDKYNGNGPVPLPVGAAVVGVDTDNGNGPVPIQVGAADVGIDTENGNGPVPIPVGAADTDNSNGPVPIPVGAANVGVEKYQGSGHVCIPVVTDVLLLLQKFVENHRKCPYKTLLNYHCPVHVKKGRTRWLRCARRGFYMKRDNVSMAQLMSDHIHQRQVYLFLRVCVLKTLPQDLIGGRHNRNVLLKSEPQVRKSENDKTKLNNLCLSAQDVFILITVPVLYHFVHFDISKLVSLGKYDKISIGQLMVSMKTVDIPWMTSVKSNSIRLHVLAKLVYWIFTQYIFVLLKTYFYITDATFLRYRLLYYRQVTWNKLHIQGVSDLVKRKLLHSISEKHVRQQFLVRSSLGISTLRFLPKQKSLRLIINMGVVTAPQLTNQKLSINKQLLDLHYILTFLKNENPLLIGYGKLGTDDIFLAWKSFVEKWRELGDRKLYFVKTDISNCYDSIIQGKLYKIMESLLQEEMEDEEYVVRKYVMVRPFRGLVQRKFHRKVAPLSEYEPDFVTFSKTLIEKEKLQNVILVDKVIHQHERTDSLLQILRAHLFNNIVKVGARYFHHSAGISQGSIISTLLCNFYYADMERRIFSIGNEEFLIRVVDDYLFVSPSLENAGVFLKQMLEGVPDYNCHTNMGKVLTNFIRHARGFSGLPVISSDWFPWCGMMFNTQTLEVCVDYSRYSGSCISDTMTFELSKNTGTAMKEKLLFSVRQKCHRLFLDIDINSWQQVHRNMHLVFLLAAYKFHAYARRLPNMQRVQDNPRYFLGVVECLAQLVCNLMNIGKKTNEEDRQQQKMSITWLCLSAFILKLNHHQSQYTVFCKSLHLLLRDLQGKLSRQRLQMLNDVIGEGLPEQFSLIVA